MRPVLFEQTLPLELCIVPCPRDARPTLGLVVPPGTESVFESLEDLLRSSLAAAPSRPAARRGMFPETALPIALLHRRQGEALSPGTLAVRFVKPEGGNPTLELRAIDEPAERALTRLEEQLSATGVVRQAYRRGRDHGGRVDGMRILSILERRRPKILES